MSRRRAPRDRRVVLHRCEDQAEAERWADAYREVLTSLGIADWWRVRIDPPATRSWSASTTNPARLADGQRRALILDDQLVSIMDKVMAR